MRVRTNLGGAGPSLLALLLVACSGPATTPSPPPSAMQPGATPPPATQPVGPTAVAASPPPALVGTWAGVHNCVRIVDVFEAAGMESQILPTIVGNGLLPGITDPADVPDPENPCDGAIELAHAHFFKADGDFGSLDQNGQRVDDGRWSIVDDDTFTINGTPFDFVVEGDELHLDAVNVGSCPADSTEFCPEAWKLMVAMPGMTWTRTQ